jgi:hypothetical protein
MSYTSHMVRSQCSQINSEAKLSSFPVISEIAIISELYLNYLEFQFSAKQFPSFRPKVYSTNRGNACFEKQCEPACTWGFQNYDSSKVMACVPISDI